MDGLLIWYCIFGIFGREIFWQAKTIIFRVYNRFVLMRYRDKIFTLFFYISVFHKFTFINLPLFHLSYHFIVVLLTTITSHCQLKVKNKNKKNEKNCNQS